MVDEEEEREIEGVDEENRRGERGGKRRLLPSDVFNLLLIPSAPAHRSQSSQSFYALLPGSPLSPNHLHPFPALLPTPILNMSDSSSSWATSSALVHTTSNIYRSRCTSLYPLPAPSPSSSPPFTMAKRPGTSASRPYTSGRPSTSAGGAAYYDHHDHHFASLTHPFFFLGFDLDTN